jgi:hypothetical protein
MQDQLMAQMQEQLSKYLANADPEVMLKTWFPESLKGFGQFQEQFWRQYKDGMSGAGMPGTSEGSKGGDKKG